MPFTVFRHHLQRQLPDFLADYTDALLAGQTDVHHLLKPYDQLAYQQVEGLTAIADRLNRTLAEVAPSDQFVDHLRRQLLLDHLVERRSWWQRIRHLPPRTQLAAGIGGATLTAGVVLIASRPFIMDVLLSWRDRWLPTT